MNIIVVTTENLNEFPPIVTLLNAMDRLGHAVKCITLYKNNPPALSKNVELIGPDKVIVDFQTAKGLKASLLFRINFIQKHIYINKMILKYKSAIQSSDIVWIAHEKTVEAGGYKFIRNLPTYLFTMYELPRKSKKIYLYAAQKAKQVVAPEYCRAHIIRARYSLSKVPAIIENSPLYHPMKRNMLVENNEIRSILDKIETSGRKIIMYMGIMSRERPLEPMIDAVITMRDKFEFVVLGPMSNYLSGLLKLRGNDFTYIGNLTNPDHLQVASHAHIAYVCYVPIPGSLNAIFCAPNKIYEFAGFGVPMVLNDVPGLKYQVENFGAGETFKTFAAKDICTAIDKINAQYDSYSNNARALYAKSDVLKEINDVLQLQ